VKEFLLLHLNFDQKKKISEESQGLSLCCCLKEGGGEFIEIHTGKQVGCKAAPVGR